MSAVTAVDLLIVGGGPAGLSAALFFSRLRRPAIVYDSGLYRNAQSPIAHTILGNEGIDPAEYRKKARVEVEKAYEWTKFVDGKIIGLHKKGNVFEAEDASGKKILARKVILATGIRDVLPSIAGLTEAWGRRAIHCIFCHGTETRAMPFAILLPPSTAKYNPMIAESIFKSWRTLDHPKTYILTHGSDTSTAQGLAQTGLERFMPLLRTLPDKYEIICDLVTSARQINNEMVITFEARAELRVPFMLVFPESMAPCQDAAPLLTKELLAAELSPQGAISPPDAVLAPLPLPPRLGDDPRTSVEGLYWAGNSGSPMANVNVSVAQGQQAAAIAAHALGSEDTEALLQHARG